MTITKSDTQLVDKDFREKIKSCVQIILDTTFSLGPKTTIKDMHGRLTFACPYCGDGEKDDKKKRGNLFWNTLQYHCYNYGCSTHKPLHTLIRDFNITEIDTNERLAIMNFIKNNSVVTSSKTIEFELFEKLTKLSIPLDVFHKITGTRPINKTSQGYKILAGRLLTNKLKEFSWRQGKLFVLNLTSDGKSVIGYQIRRIANDGNNKYFTFNLEKLRQLAGESTINLCEDEQELERLNKLSTIFGILTIDFTKTITSFEGPIDAKFMVNSIGQATVGRDMGMFDNIPNIRYFYDNDKSGKEAAAEHLKNGHEVFLWKKYISDYELMQYVTSEDPIKDLNDIIKLCYKNKLDSYRYINKYFSNKIIDLYYI